MHVHAYMRLFIRQVGRPSTATERRLLSALEDAHAKLARMAQEREELEVQPSLSSPCISPAYLPVSPHIHAWPRSARSSR